MKFIVPAFVALLGVGLCYQGDNNAAEEGATLQKYNNGNRGLGLGNQWKGRDNRWIGNENVIDGEENNVVGNRNNAAGRANWIHGQSNDIKGKKNVVQGRGNIIRGKGNVVSNGGGNMDFDIESMFPAWMRKDVKKRKMSNGRGPKRFDEDYEEVPWMRRGASFAKRFKRGPAWMDDTESIIGFNKDDNQEGSYRSNRSRGRNWERESYGQSRRDYSGCSDRSSPLRESLRERIQRQIEREFEGYGQ